MQAKTPSSFTLNEQELEIINHWISEHAKTCAYLGPRTAGWFGSPIHYRFTPTSLGTEVHVLCNCGADLYVDDGSEL